MTQVGPAVPQAREDIERAARFGFGANWRRFLSILTDERIAQATQSLVNIFGAEGLQGKRFLDIGCGSGLFSLAAYRLGAHVHSFDFDPDSVACAEYLREREGATIDGWQIERGSALDGEYLERLGTFDVVYSWGVLHHTGAMWTAIDNASRCVADGGQFWISIYNDQGLNSRMWTQIKRLYVRLPSWLRLPYVCLIGGIYYGSRMLLRLVQMTAASLVRLMTLRNPFTPWITWGREMQGPQSQRGMNRWYDLVDWVGGYPFEVARPEEVFRFLRDRGFRLTDMTTCGGGLGCNEFVFQKENSSTGRNESR